MRFLRGGAKRSNQSEAEMEKHTRSAIQRYRFPRQPVHQINGWTVERAAAIVAFSAAIFRGNECQGFIRGCIAWMRLANKADQQRNSLFQIKKVGPMFEQAHNLFNEFIRE